MKKMTYLAMLALAGLMVTGCASNQPNNPVTEWQESRIMSAQIAAKKGTPLTIADVTYQSTLSNAALAAPVNTFALVPAGLYQQVVKGVDEMAAVQDGRMVFRDVCDKVSSGTKRETALAELSAEDKAAYDAYVQAIKMSDQDTIMNTVVIPLINQITAESAKVADLLEQIKNDPTFQSLTGFDLMKESKNLMADGSALTTQFNDTLAGANIWLQLLQRDKEDKAYLSNYPAE